MKLNNEKFQDISLPHKYFRTFPFQCNCGCNQIAFFEEVTRVGHFDSDGGYWEYFILGHWEKMVEKSHTEHPEIPVCPVCKTHWYVGKSGSWRCNRCGHNF